MQRWESSEMNAEPVHRRKNSRVKFQDSDIFLSACMSGDEEEVEELLAKGADINTATVDGLTALHQSVIDSKPEMVRFLCEKGADVNAQDNEGWTPLHAAACCGNLAIVKYLCQNGARLNVINSDKELALDLADDESCREYLERDYRDQGVIPEQCRDQELAIMMRDAQQWLRDGEYRDQPHRRTGATALHVAAAKGYTQLLELLIKAGGNIRAPDKDGWTPLHAAAHWAEKDSCKILLEHGASITDTNYAVSTRVLFSERCGLLWDGSTSSIQSGDQHVSATVSIPTRPFQQPSSWINRGVQLVTRPWQSSAVIESEAERRNTARMQRQHRRSTQGVTKEHLEEASRIAMAENARRRALAASQNVPSNGLTVSRSNRRGTGPVLPEDIQAAVSVRQITESGNSATTAARTAPAEPAPTVIRVAGTVASVFTRPTVSSVSTGRPDVYMPTFFQYTINSRPTEMNLNYKALYEKEKLECERLRKEVEELKRSGSVPSLRTAQSRFRIGSPASGASPIAKSASGNSIDDSERRALERKIADLEIQLKGLSQLRMENQRLKEENGALVRVISKMTI
ncbi:unnamed protein product [Haemonchus placei]|uniref:cGMP-dependent protein kinase interacting domain-containing protein n=1 Tax=Haemonchus placei TaxID=6290 RepID=A0A3P7Z6N1_HAEPC|nr:unnamed protein product [Haemonchus placei]